MTTQVGPQAAPVPVPARPPRPWRRRLGALPFVTLAALTVALGGYLLASGPGAKESEAEAKADAPADRVSFAAERWESAGIAVEPVSVAPWVDRVWRSGRVARNEERVARLVPPVEGVVHEVPARLGQAVRAGDVLAVLDCRELGLTKLDWLRAKAALAAEEEHASRVRTTMANARELLDLLAAGRPVAEIEKALADKPIGDYRQQLLGAYSRRNQLAAQVASARNLGASASETNLRKTESESEAASAAYTAAAEEARFQVSHQVRTAELKLREAQIAADSARTKMLLLGVPAGAVAALDPIAEGAKASHLAIRAPFAGTVVEKHAVPSERVGPTSALFTLADTSSVWVQAELYETDLPLLRGLVAGSKVTFRSRVGGVEERAAEVVSAGEQIDRATRTLTLTAQAPNGDGLLKSGLHVEVAFDTIDPTPTPQVPAAAVLRHENVTFVFVKSGGGEFRKAPVTLGRTAAGRAEVTAGLTAADAVVTRGGFVLKSELFKDQMVGE